MSSPPTNQHLRYCACGCGTPLQNPTSRWAHGHNRIANPIRRKGSTVEVSAAEHQRLSDRARQMSAERVEIEKYARQQGWPFSGKLGKALTATQKVKARRALGYEVTDQLAERARREDPSKATPQAETIDGIPLGNITPAQRLRLRRKAQTDLWWLCTEIFGLPLIPRVHREIIDLFPQRDPDIPFAHHSECKQRLLVASRNSFKSTIAVIALIQVILCAPDTRALILRGTLKLAKQQLREVKVAFSRNIKVQALFPEHCVDKIKELGNADEFICPARREERREPTISILTPEAEGTGLHVDYMSVDDIVNPSSVNTPDQIRKAVAFYHALAPILEPWGEKVVINTPYTVGDLTYVIRQMHEDAGPTSDWKVVWRGAWTRKPNTPEDSENEQDYELWYPERLDWQTLQKHKREMEATGHGHIFRAQYLCEFSSSAGKIRMDEARLLLNTVPPTSIPDRNPSRTFCFWDLAYSDRVGSDFTVGIVGQFDGKGRCYAIDLVRDRFGPHEIAGRIVELAGKWEPAAVGIEDSLGARFLLPQLLSLSLQCGTRLNIIWVPALRVKGAKLARILALEGWLKSNRLFFSSALPSLKELYRQLATPGVGKDDCADALSQLVGFESYVPKEDFWSRVEQATGASAVESHPLDSASPLGFGW